MKSCPICQSSYVDKMHNLYDDRYGYPGIFFLLKCKICEHKFLDQNFSASELTDMYSHYYPRSQFSLSDFEPLSFMPGFNSWLNGEHCSAFTYVPPQVKVLDIGCGFGQALGYHQARGCDVYGVEADKNIKRVAEQFDFHVKVGLFDPDDYDKCTFDYVTMDQVLEHVTDPYAVMHGVNRILKPGGYLIVSFPNADGWGAKIFGKKWVHWHAPYHLQFYSKKSIDTLVSKTGFTILSNNTITSSEWLNYQWRHLISYPGIEEKSWFWSGKKNKKNYAGRGAFKLLSIIHKLRINHIVTRAFDTLKSGDNVVVILKKAGQ